MLSIVKVTHGKRAVQRQGEMTYFVALDLGLVRTGCPESLDLCLCFSPLTCHLQQIIWGIPLERRANPAQQKLNFLQRKGKIDKITDTDTLDNAC